MGLLDFDINRVVGNDAFQLGMNILGNNRYGDNTGMALGAGLQDYQRQKSLQAQQARANAQAEYQAQQQQQQQEMWAQQKVADEASRERLSAVRAQYPDNSYAQLDPKGYLANQAKIKANLAKTNASNQFDIGLESFKAKLKNINDVQKQNRGFNLEQYGNQYGPQTPSAPQGAPQLPTAPQGLPQGVPQNAPRLPLQGGQPSMSFAQRQKANFEQAKTESKLQAEDADLLKIMESNMPALMEMTDQLKVLSKDATYTLAGQGFDTIAKQGFGVTSEGALARKTFEATVNNSVLPLLRQTFGAAFTKAEGDSLRETLGDIDATPEEKTAVIDAFVENKVREIQSKQRKVKGYKALPADAGRLQAGQVYTTPKGPLRWNGKVFEEIQ